LFVALKGERFDGHDFVAHALASGAAAALVADSRAASLDGNLIAVADPLQALGALAAFWRSRFDIPVVVVVGSNGKTTTKEMIAAIFRAAEAKRRRGHAGQLQQCDRRCRSRCSRCARRIAGVFEIGMNHRGETRELAQSRSRRSP
jgi:UDP-N-acetylmuramoyl-tripeptide--D-alanyl-D-alanine ligase